MGSSNVYSKPYRAGARGFGVHLVCQRTFIDYSLFNDA